MRRVVVRFYFSCNLTGNRPQSLTGHTANVTDNTKWIAKVINNNDLAISFTPIDNCIIVLKEGTLDKESTCDGMLTFSNSLYLVELKKHSLKNQRL